MESVINKLAEIETAATKIMQAAENQKKLQDEQRMFGAALLFGAANALQIRLQTIGVSISPFLLAILPYALTLIAMLGAAGKSSEPEALSKPYIKGSR